MLITTVGFHESWGLDLSWDTMISFELILLTIHIAKSDEDFQASWYVGDICYFRVTNMRRYQALCVKHLDTFQGQVSASK